MEGVGFVSGCACVLLRFSGKKVQNVQTDLDPCIV